MKILGVDLTANYSSVAIKIDDDINSISISHSTYARPDWDKLLNNLFPKEIILDDLDAVAYANGPGSFTSLRSAAAFTKAIAASKKIPIYDIAISVIEYENKVLITKRQNTKFLSGLWEFPGGKIEKHETAVQAIVREVKEETNLTISDPLFLGNVSHKYSHFGVNISLFISFPKSIKSLNLPQEYQWIRMKDILNYPLPKANHKMLDILKKLD